MPSKCPVCNSDVKDWILTDGEGHYRCQYCNHVWTEQED